MKKAAFFILTILCLLACAMPVSAASAKTYTLPELDLTIAIPSGYTAITRDMSAYHPVFDLYGLDGSATLTYMENQNIYLDALSSDPSKGEITVTMSPVEGLNDFSVWNDTALNAFLPSLIDMYEQYGLTISSYDIYQQSQTKFIRVYGYNPEIDKNGLQYYTLNNNQGISVTMYASTGELTAAQEATLKGVVDSIRFKTPPSTTTPPPPTPSFVYTDEESGVSFTVPANWTEKPVSTERADHINAKFVSPQEAGISMLYLCEDLWANLTPSEQREIQRADIDNAYFTASELADIYGINASEIDIVTYNDIPYYQMEVDYTSEEYGFPLSITMMQVLYVEDGWGYSFQFSGAQDSAYFADFESLLNSVTYPEPIADDVNTDLSDMETTSADPHDQTPPFFVWIVLLVIVGVLLALLVHYRRRKQEYPSSPTAPVTPPFPTMPPPPSYPPAPFVPSVPSAPSAPSAPSVPSASSVPSAPSVAAVPPTDPRQEAASTAIPVYCRHCGQALPSTSTFCHMCGAKIHLENKA